MKILLPDTMPLDPHLPDGCQAVVVDAGARIPAEHRDAEVLVYWGASPGHLASAAQDLPKLRLVQSLSAGVDAIMRAGFKREVAVASGAGLHDRTVTEHTLALVLTLVRRMPFAREEQQRHAWSAQIGGLQELHPRDRVTTLLGARVLIAGFGQIARTLAPVLATLGSEVTGVARSPGERDGFRVVAESAMHAELATTDVFISILPATDSTRGIINKQVFAALPRRALFVNVGRGAVVDQTALRDALLSGEIGGAAIDVADPEPLPPDSPLWDTPHLVITPHAAGGRPVGADERIAHNVVALLEGLPLLHAVR